MEQAHYAGLLRVGRVPPRFDPNFGPLGEVI